MSSWDSADASIRGYPGADPAFATADRLHDAMQCLLLQVQAGRFSAGSAGKSTIIEQTAISGVATGTSRFGVGFRSLLRSSPPGAAEGRAPLELPSD
jgi:hypothetical protein